MSRFILLYKDVQTFSLENKTKILMKNIPLPCCSTLRESTPTDEILLTAADVWLTALLMALSVQRRLLNERARFIRARVIREPGLSPARQGSEHFIHFNGCKIQS